MFDTLRWPDGKLLTYKLVVAVDRKFVVYDVIISVSYTHLTLPTILRV